MAVSEYRVVACMTYESDGDGLDQLEKLVGEAISEGGWQPQGGISTMVTKSQGGFEYSYYQAMVR